jgi:hypothetical protein
MPITRYLNCYKLTDYFYSLKRNLGLFRSDLNSPRNEFLGLNIKSV